METIPLRPVFENHKFQKLKPAQQMFVLNAVYRLCVEGKESEPIPNNLRHHLYCSEATYFRYIAMFRDVLIEVMPKIDEIKNKYRKQSRNSQIIRSKKAVELRKSLDKDVVISDRDSTHMQIVPVFSPRKNWNDGKFDHVARAKAIKNNEQSDKETWFKDK